MSENPLLTKLLCDPAALNWLKDHPEFGGVDSYRGGRRAFSRNANPDVALFIEKLDFVKSRLTAEQQKVATWYVAMPPRDVARRFGVPVKRVYRLFDQLRQTVESEFASYRDEQVSTRAGHAELETLPEHCALASRHFEYRGARRVVYRVQQITGPTWVDETGRIFEDDVQDVLDELHEHAPGFTGIEGE